MNMKTIRLLILIMFTIISACNDENIKPEIVTQEQEKVIPSISAFEKAIQPKIWRALSVSTNQSFFIAYDNPDGCVITTRGDWGVYNDSHIYPTMKDLNIKGLAFSKDSVKVTYSTSIDECEFYVENFKYEWKEYDDPRLGDNYIAYTLLFNNKSFEIYWYKPVENFYYFRFTLDDVPDHIAEYSFIVK